MRGLLGAAAGKWAGREVDEADKGVVPIPGNSLLRFPRGDV